jgi:hypothetical protein
MQSDWIRAASQGPGLVRDGLRNTRRPERRRLGARAFDFEAIRAELGFGDRQAEAMPRQTASDPGTLF